MSKQWRIDSERSVNTLSTREDGPGQHRIKTAVTQNEAESHGASQEGRRRRIGTPLMGSCWFRHLRVAIPCSHREGLGGNYDAPDNGGVTQCYLRRWRSLHCSERHCEREGTQSISNRQDRHEKLNMFNFSGGSPLSSRITADDWGLNTVLIHFSAEHGGMPNCHEPPSEPPMCKRSLSCVLYQKGHLCCENCELSRAPNKQCTLRLSSVSGNCDKFQEIPGN